jgi:hypothetical protein
MVKSLFDVVLSDKQQEAFSEAFYSLCSFDDTDTTHPYGCPWHWDDGVSFFSESRTHRVTAEELAKIWYEHLREVDEDFRGWDDGTKSLDDEK